MSDGSSQSAVKKPLPAEPEVSPSAEVQPALKFGLEDGTPIKLEFLADISSKTAQISDVVEFAVTDFVLVDGVVVIRER